MKHTLYRLFALLMVVSMVAACAAPAATPTARPGPAARSQPAAPTAAPAQPTAAPAQPTTAPAQPAAPTSKYKQAPMLDADVASGKLPPVDQRLPEQPLVVPDGGQHRPVWRRVAARLHRPVGLQQLRPRGVRCAS